MCGRSSLYEEPRELLESYGLPPRLSGYRPRYNIAPSQTQWAILENEDKLEVRELRWGLIPSWAGDAAIGNKLINARAETVAEKPSFRTALRKRRCVILVDGYYEWSKTPGGKTPFRFQLSSRAPFVLAGLWERWEAGDSPIESCTIITTTASESVAHVHNRMPVIMHREESLRWMRTGASVEDLLALLTPYSGDDLEMFEVSRVVNSPANDSADCVQRLRATPPVTE